MPLKDASVILGYKGVTFYGESSMVDILVVVTTAAREATVKVLVIVSGSTPGVSTSAGCGLRTS